MSESFFPTPPNHPFSRPFISMPITELAGKLFNPKAEYRPKIIEVQKRIRGVLAGKIVFDTTSAKLVWEHKWFPQYWIPRADFLPDAAEFTDDKPLSGIQTSTSRLTVRSGGEAKSVKTLLVPESFNTPLAGLVKISFDALDQWFEEQVEVVYHPKDPFHRVDCLPTGRKVKVEIDGVVLADTRNEGGVISLWETGFPGRWYLPKTAVNWEYLTPSSTHTGCPYKGEASYYNAVINGKEYKDVVWWYKAPTAESVLITGLLCFYPDKVDMWVDGKKAEKAGMPFAKDESKDESKDEGEAKDHAAKCAC